jgi:hypothetical protein
MIEKFHTSTNFIVNSFNERFYRGKHFSNQFKTILTSHVYFGLGGFMTKTPFINLEKKLLFKNKLLPQEAKV